MSGVSVILEAPIEAEGNDLPLPGEIVIARCILQCGVRACYCVG